MKQVCADDAKLPAKAQICSYFAFPSAPATLARQSINL
jgi:hypothetical protein